MCPSTLPNQARYPLRYTRIFGFVGGEPLYGAVCAGDTACKATAWSIDSADGVCAGRCGGDNAYPTMFRGKKQQGAGRKSAAPCFAYPPGALCVPAPLMRLKTQGALSR